MYYNIAIKGGFVIDIQFVCGVTAEELKKLIYAYEFGKDSIMISGKRITIKDCSLFKIFNVKRAESTPLSQYKNEISHKIEVWRKLKSKSEILREEGEDITSEFIVVDWGEKASFITDRAVLKEFIHSSRIAELENIKTKTFDFTKLIKLCNELNSSFNSNNFFATGAMARAIIDHVPPIFGCKSFKEVANNYKSPGTIKSFSDVMKHLDESMRKISDKYLHSQITNKEALPNETQVDCKRDLDVLLEEIVRIFKQN